MICKTIILDNGDTPGTKPPAKPPSVDEGINTTVIVAVGAIALILILIMRR